MSDWPISAAGTCLKCSGPTELGFLSDIAGQGASAVSSWIAGVPVLNVFGTLKGRPLRGRVRLQTRAMRCVDCGLLELYARSEFSDS